jgi:RimJ/RimL family protein N-acetyltransferase
MKHLESERLCLRPFELNDFDAVHAWATDELVTRYTPWGPNSEEDTRGFLERAIAGARDANSHYSEFAIVERASAQVVGGCGLSGRRIQFREYEIGWTVNREFWRRGFATEAGGLAVQYAFSDLGAHRLYATIDFENEASMGVARKLEFREEGYFRGDLLIRGKWRDSRVFARLEP